MTLASTVGGLSTWDATIPVAAAAAEGRYRLDVKLVRCSDEIQFDVGTMSTYVVDRTSPAVTNAVPAAEATTTLTNPRISAFILDAGGVNSSSVAATLDGAPVAGTALTIQTTAVGSRVEFVATGLAAGSHVVALSATDFLGHAVAHSWTFGVGELTLSPSRVSADWKLTTLPLLTKPGDAVSIDSRIRVDEVRFSAAYLHSEGVGTICGKVNLSGLRASFEKVDGTRALVAPSSFSPPQRYVCDTVISQGKQSLNGSLPAAVRNLGPLNFAAPVGTKPGGSVYLTFASAEPQVDWEQPCFAAPASPTAAGAITVNTCELLPNPTAGLDAFMRATNDRAGVWASEGYPHRQMTELAVLQWDVAGGTASISDSAVDVTLSSRVNRLLPSSPYSPADNSAPSALVALSTYTPTEDADAEALTEAIAFAPGGLVGSSTSSYLALTWEAGLPGSTVSKFARSADGVDLSLSSDAQSRPVIWSAYEDASRGSVIGLRAGDGVTPAVAGFAVRQTAPAAGFCFACTLRLELFRAAGGASRAVQARTVGLGVIITPPNDVLGNAVSVALPCPEPVSPQSIGGGGSGTQSSSCLWLPWVSPQYSDYGTSFYGVPMFTKAGAEPMLETNGGLVCSPPSCNPATYDSQGYASSYSCFGCGEFDEDSLVTGTWKFAYGGTISSIQAYITGAGVMTAYWVEYRFPYIWEATCQNCWSNAWVDAIGAGSYPTFSGYVELENIENRPDGGDWIGWDATRIWF